MATRSHIAIEQEDGTFKAVYCHWDGHPSHNGKILLDHYTDRNTVLALLAEGDMSSLGESIGEKHDFDARLTKETEGWTTFYGRDRGETDVDAEVLEDYADLFESANGTVDYLYVFKPDNKWYFFCLYEKDATDDLQLLTPEDCVE